jgi:phage shock protein C
MNMRGKRFEIDRENGKLLGVCAGIANHFGIDATLVRIGVVAVTIMGAFPWTLIAYGIAWYVGRPKARAAAYGRTGHGPSRPSVSPEESRERMRAIDLRMQAIETYVTSSNSSLAREIENLR